MRACGRRLELRVFVGSRPGRLPTEDGEGDARMIDRYVAPALAAVPLRARARRQVGSAGCQPGVGVDAAAGHHGGDRSAVERPGRRLAAACS